MLNFERVIDYFHENKKKEWKIHKFLLLILNECLQLKLNHLSNRKNVFKATDSKCQNLSFLHIKHAYSIIHPRNENAHFYNKRNTDFI